jgi:hypothetical protein
MFSDVNWWLLALAFLLGLVLTLVLTIGRVKREVPVNSSAVENGESVPATPPEPPTAKAAAGDDESTIATAEAAEKAEQAEKDESVPAPDQPKGPYGAGSARAGADGSGPPGWPVKATENPKLYRTPDSPSYEQTVAQVWFKDEESAEQGGFAAWHQ